MDNQTLAKKLIDINAIQFGTFTLKSGITSPIYIDLRLIVSYPNLLDAVAAAIWSKVEHIEFDLLCGVPYTALPIATALSLQEKVPMLLTRKEPKSHGLKKMVEGVYTKGQSCLLVEDLISSGISLLETIAHIEKEELIVNDTVVLIDREQGGKERLEEKGYQLHSVLTLTELLQTLETLGRIDSATVSKVQMFIKNAKSANTHL